MGPFGTTGRPLRAVPVGRGGTSCETRRLLMFGFPSQEGGSKTGLPPPVFTWWAQDSSGARTRPASEGMADRTIVALRSDEARWLNPASLAQICPVWC
jgi:hypothetical protein